MWTATYWKQVAERMIKGAAGAVAATYVGGDVISDFWSLDWKEALGIAMFGAMASLVMSLLSAPIGDHATPSLVATTEPGSGRATSAHRS